MSDVDRTTAIGLSAQAARNSFKLHSCSNESISQLLTNQARKQLVSRVSGQNYVFWRCKVSDLFSTNENNRIHYIKPSKNTAQVPDF